MSYAFHLDLSRCTGCFACAVACMDQNDTEITTQPTAFRQVFTIETGSGDEARLQHVSLACMHCEDAPCLIACPGGAISRDSNTGIVTVSADLCIGCHSCSIACPFGVPRFGADGTMQKCDLCAVRIENGLDPACVRVCPTGALRYGRPNELGLEVEKRAARKLVAGT